MRIKDFIVGRNVELQAVQKYIIRHPELFEGHIDKSERNMDLDEVAVDLLNKKYPLIQKIEIYNGVSHEEHKAVLEELNKKNNYIIQLQNELNAVNKQLGDIGSSLARLEEKDKSKDKIIAEQEESLKTAENTQRNLNNRVDQLLMQLEIRNNRIKEMENRKWWERLLNK